MLLGHQTVDFYHFAEFIAFSLPFLPKIKLNLIGNDMKHLFFQPFFFFFLIRKNVGKTDCMPRLLALEVPFLFRPIISVREQFR